MLKEEEKNSEIQFLSEIEKITGSKNLLIQQEDLSSYIVDWRKIYHGQALAVVLPVDTIQVSKIVQLCSREKIAIIPQGGNTGMCGGATPLPKGRQIILSLQRMNKIREIDIQNQTMSVEAGCILKEIQNAAIQKNYCFPLSMAAEGSCTIGGNLSTNAGGTSVLRYGSARDLCLGIEIITPKGEILNSMRSLRKDNTGYDLRNLYIGSEGTLGIITAAIIKLFPNPINQLTSLIVTSTPESCVEILNFFQKSAFSELTAFEVMSHEAIELLEKYYPNLSSPLIGNYIILVELSEYSNIGYIEQLMEKVLENIIESNLANDAIIANNLSQAKKFWNMREHIPIAQANDGHNIKHDISLPISNIPKFINSCNQFLKNYYPGIRIINYGHLGDGNLHYNIAAPCSSDSEDFFFKKQAEIQQFVFGEVEKYSGSISAEHGIGQQKVNYLLSHRGKLAYQIMYSIKRTLDPENIMNPGKVICIP